MERFKWERLRVKEGGVLVTGAAGMIGHAVRSRLEREGRHVLAVDRSSGEIDGLSVLACDVTDLHALYGLALEHRIGSVIHCGAVSGPMVAADNPASVVEVNVHGTANLLELVRRLGGIRLVFCSSTSAVGPTPPGLTPVPEDVPLRPSTVYGATKAAGESLTDGYARQFGVDAVSLRLSWVYGPRRTTSCSIRRMLADALSGRPTRLPHGGAAARQYVYVDDAAAALIQAHDAGSLPRSSYTITGGTWQTLDSVKDVVRMVVPQADIIIGADPDPEDDVQAAFDISAAARDFGYVPQVTLEQGLRAYRDWMTKQSVEPRPNPLAPA